MVSSSVSPAPTHKPLTPPAVNALKARDQKYDVFDAQVPGLAVRVSPSGLKSWRLYYRHHGRLHRVTLGHYPDVGLATARKRATKERGRIFDGAHPVGERKADRQTWGDTVGALVDAYGKSPIAKQRRWSEKSRILENEVRRAWGDRRVRDITRRDVRTLVEKKATTAPVMANRLLATISALLNWALDHDWIEASPASRLRPVANERHRERVLASKELGQLWDGLTDPDPEVFVKAKVVVPHPAERDVFLLLLLLGQRLTETASMRWADVDLATRWWTIPGAVAKNEQPHRVPLTEPALKVLRRRAADPDRDSIYVFSRTRGASVAARAKKVAAVLSKALGFSFGAHDLRRSCATGMGQAGVPRFDIACVLNHRSVTKHGVTAIYDQYTYDREKRRALERWAKAVQAILDKRASGASNVVAFR